MSDTIQRPAEDLYVPLLRQAFEEDHTKNDLTSTLTIPSNTSGHAQIIARESGVFCGNFLVNNVYSRIDESITVDCTNDGTRFRSGDELCRIKGALQEIFAGERIILNFLQQLSGISTTTKKYSRAISNHKTTLLDTRKTTPGWRALEKYAVRVGGGTNHRMHLSDMILIKENHIHTIEHSFKQPIQELNRRIDQARSQHPDTEIEIEVSRTEDLETFLNLKPDRLMLDNFSPEEVETSVNRIRSFSKETDFDIQVEVSGGITMQNIQQYAEHEPDFISAGHLTHSVNHIDMSMLLNHVQT